MTPDEFLPWLINNKPVTVIFEACSTSNDWKQKAIEAGHDARLVSAKLVSLVRQIKKLNQVTFQTIKQLSSAFPIVKLCKVMKISRSAYYAWLNRPAKLITAEQLHLYRRAKTIFK